MSLSAGSITDVLGLDVNPYRQGFLQAQTLMGTFPNLVTSFMASPMLGFANVCKSAMSVVVNVFQTAFGTIKGMIDDAFGRADKMFDLSKSLGIDVEDLSAMEFAASQAGVGLETLGASLKFIQDNAVDASRGNKTMAAEFDRLGISVRGASGEVRPAVDLMMDLADAMNATESGAERIKAAQTLLGKGGTTMVSFMADGSAAIREQMNLSDQYGATISNRFARTADTFGDLWGEARAAWSGIKNMLAEPVLEALTPVLKNVLSWIRQHQPEIRAIMQKLAADISRSVVDMANAVISGANGILRAVALMIDAIGRLDSIIKGFLAGKIGGAIAGGAIGGFVGGPVGIIPGAVLGSQIGGAAGVGIGYAVGGSNNPVIQIAPVKIDMTGNVDDSLRRAQEQQRRETVRAIEEHQRRVERWHAIRRGVGGQ